jgi:hypothetical protein
VSGSKMAPNIRSFFSLIAFFRSPTVASFLMSIEKCFSDTLRTQQETLISSSELIIQSFFSVWLLSADCLLALHRSDILESTDQVEEIVTSANCVMD